MAETKFDIKSEATRPFFATVGATDLAVEVARQYVADVQAKVLDVQKKVAAYDFEPKSLNTQAQKVVSSRVDNVTKEAKDRQAKLESRLAELQAELKDAQSRFEAKLADLQADAKSFPGRAQAFVTDYVNDVTGTYTDLVKRGEKAVAKLRKVEVKVDVDSKQTKTTVTTGVKTTEGVKKPAAKKPATKKAPAAKKPAAKKAPAAQKAPATNSAPAAKPAASSTESTAG